MTMRQVCHPSAHTYARWTEQPHADWLVFPVAQDDDVAVIGVEDVGAAEGPVGWVLAGPGGGGWRGGGQSVVRSGTAARAGFSSGEELPPAIEARRGRGGRVVDAPARAAA